MKGLSDVYIHCGTADATRPAGSWSNWTDLEEYCVEHAYFRQEIRECKETDIDSRQLLGGNGPPFCEGPWMRVIVLLISFRWKS